ncbi:DUF368 domain-containing protein [Aureitalea marina]|uniref:DUF368 domain-containing protein n=1 Tax=Aureitalea marina TaxID=930804 RepID=A0A2S7KQ13_9FLAO|nr:DUF368 domain-containing protein [Aureitalea marina]PQB04714.1 DUF368 domain-containing protein [Aureitalea marina]
MEQTRTLSDRIWLFLKGLAMGAANKVPGVSGGMIAFVAGFYEEFIYSLQKINSKAFKLLINGRFKSFYQYINGRFLGLLFLGMIVSYFSVSKLLDYFLVHYELYVWSAFFGMIIGSIYYVAKDFGDWTRANMVYLLLGVMVGIGISFLEPATENRNLIFVFFCGMISVSGMTLPGLSGSFILILIGNYVLLLVDAVNALYDTMAELIGGSTAFMDNPERIDLLIILVVFSLGSLAGLIFLSHMLAYVLKRFHQPTFAVIIGFITGSLGVVWPWKNTIYDLKPDGTPMLDSSGKPIIDNYERYWPSSLDAENLLAILFILLGIGIVLGLDIYQRRNKQLTDG